MRSFDLQGYSYEERGDILPQLTAAFTSCGGWVLERKTTSPTQIEFRLEIQRRGIVELYSALVAAGIELTRSAHATLVDLCTCLHHSRSSHLRGQILSIRLELNFLGDVTLHSLLMTGCAAA